LFDPSYQGCFFTQTLCFGRGFFRRRKKVKGVPF
jgi:hypothetical protein